MPIPISKEVIEERIRNYPHDNYIYIGSVLKGAALSFAAVSLLWNFADMSDRWIRLFPWVASLGAVCVTYLTWGRGVILSNSRANLQDTIYPLIMGISEVLMFAILLDNKILSENAAPGVWLLWPFVMSAHGFLGFLLVCNRVKDFDLHADFEKDVRPLGLQLMRWMKENRMGALIVGVSSFGVGILVLLARELALEGYCKAILVLFSGILSLIFFAVICRGAVNDRKCIDEFVSNLR